MGCGQDKRQIQNDKISKDKCLYEDYKEINPYTYSISYYNITWKKKPNICIFQKISEEIVEKSIMKNLNIVIEKMKIFPNDKMKFSINQNQILFYLFCSNGVIITRNSHKINYYISNYIDNIINLSFVDLALIMLPEKEYFSIYELKRQSKYFFDLNMKEVDFTKRNELTNDGKLEQLSDFEDLGEEIEIDEKNEKKYEDIEIKINRDHFDGEYMKNEDKNFLGIEDMKKKESISNGNIIIDVNSIMNKDKNLKLLSEIIEYGNKDTKKGKSKKIEKSQIETILNKNKNSNIMNILSQDKMSINNDKKIINANDDVMTMISNDKKNKSKSKDKKEGKNKGKNKNMNSSKNKGTLIKNDKLLFKNKKELNKAKNMNIKIFPLSKQTSTMFNESSEKKIKLISHINDTNRNLININSSKKDINNLLINKGENKEKPTDPPAYKIKDKTLIILTNKLTREINSELQKILFIQDNQNSFDDGNDNDNNKKMNYLIESCFDHVNFDVEKKKSPKKRGRNSISLEDRKSILDSLNINRRESVAKEDKNNNSDYILIFNKNRIPFDKKKSSHKIKKIVFTHCKFNSESIYHFKELISMLVKYEDLKKIYFIKNEMDSNFIGWKFLKQLFRENFSIRWVSFKNSNLNDNIFENIISSLILKRIRYLNFSNNNITNKSMYLLNTFLIKNQTLSILDLSRNENVNKDGIKIILNSLKLHPNIYKLDFSFMNITGSGEYISSLLLENKCVHILLLKNDKLNEKDMEFLSKELSKRESTLEYLDLSENPDVGKEGLKEIGKIIYNNESLKSIGLDGMNLSINNYLPIFKGIFKNKNIEYYSMSKNEGLPLKGILNFFQKNPQVKKLNIIPWDRENDENEENKFSEQEIFLLEKFHLKAPNVDLQGIKFIDFENYIY